MIAGAFEQSLALLVDELSGDFDLRLCRAPEDADALLESGAAPSGVVCELDFERRTEAGFDVLERVSRRAPSATRVLVIRAPLRVATARRIVRTGVAHRLVVEPWYRGEISLALRYRRQALRTGGIDRGS